MKVYHGSAMEINDIDLLKCESYRDFGRGFYVTNIRKQAEFWAERRGRKNRDKGFVTEFEFSETAFEFWKLNVLRFACYSEDWLDFVVLNRNQNLPPEPAHDYDIVEGPVADDKVTLRLEVYLQGGISKPDFLEELTFFKHTHQICFCTQRSLQALEKIQKKPCSGSIDNQIIQMLANDYGMSDEKSIDTYFESETYKQLIDPNSNLYEQPWQKIYEMLKKELKP